MSDYFLGEVRMFSFAYAPRGWALCQGQLIPISQNQALFSLLAYQYGGTANQNFALPDLRGRALAGAGTQFGTTLAPGAKAGTETVALTAQQIPQHTHQLQATNTSPSIPVSPANELFADVAGAQPTYATPGTLVALDTSVVSMTGGSAPHPNMQPFLVTNYCISTAGLYPTRQ